MPGLHFILPLLGVLSLLSVSSQSQSADSGVLLVANKADSTLGIVDPAAGVQVATVAEDGTTGHEVVASPDGRLAYVPIYGNSGVGKPGTDGRNMVVIDIAARKVIGNLDFGHAVRPHCAVIGPQDGLLYVTTELDQQAQAVGLFLTDALPQI